jgi:hypothetical protein
MQPRSDALVLNQYSLAFHRKISATPGTSFFSVTSASPAKITDVLEGVYPVSGTLLPSAEAGSATADTKFTFWIWNSTARKITPLYNTGRFSKVEPWKSLERAF